ncbi:FKBP-type peptidyl-prolyl cis-trans isomerase [Solirubrobacter sp. CPCC 204708]|uniref:Peptidyl-prolyl cis-trans isomerase n=1 Tax=Solirubrobacter deserti TaxID=2282478 RepID=A0ABT4RTQ2_9ACTN|nr:FKBP-type peptidyl-prolyl cis-trans isomerase [Solirubrobacter deserti]MBE2318317.1 FKBP-type peptidyl-prolyl cis-trans isomerase [Solirubrobacter deserti]MDA0141916.1 FKBP-type peptidyl-prolyl cis-trans isomerase [Solirubrobacter deserti]
MPAVALALAFAACGDDEPEETAATPTATEAATEAPTEAPTETPAAEGGSSSGGGEVEVTGDVGEKPEIKTPGGEGPTELVSEDLEEGKGTAAKAGDTVQVQYSGVLYSDGTPFDNSFDRGEPFEFQLGAGMVIPGWDQGVEGMKEGGRRVLTIPSDLAYGDAGAPPTIPPGATLVFVVDLEKINP